MKKSLERVYTEHKQGLFSLALAITGSRQQAEDSIHDAFAKLIHRQRPEGDMVAYVFMSVKNAAIDLQRRNRRNHQMSESLFNGYYPPSSKDKNPSQDLLTKERDEILREAVKDLPEPQRDAIIMKALAGLTFEQAGEALQISPKTLATRYRRGLSKLESRLRGQV